MKKPVIIIVSIMAIYIFVMLFIFTILPGIMYTTIVLEDNVRWRYSKDGWKDYDPKAELNGYKIYNPNNGDYVGKYDIQYTNKGWFVKVNREFKLYDKSMLAVKSSKFKVYNFEIETLTDNTIITSILNKASLKATDGATVGNQIQIDLDNDGSSEIIYGITNMDEMGNVRFYVMAIYIDGGYKIIKKVTGDNVPSIYVYSIVDFDRDSNLELIIKESYFSMSGCDYSLYSLVDGEYKLMISTGGSL